MRPEADVGGLMGRLASWWRSLPAGRASMIAAWTGALVVAILTLLAVRPLFGGGMIFTADTLHAWRIYETGLCIDDGQLPCRWVPDLGLGYGFPVFNYYSPLPYFAGSLIHRLGFSYLQSVDALAFIGLMGAGLSMYVLGRRLWGELGGVVSAVAYVFTPYLALDVYMRGALAELWALAFLPALLWALYELVTSDNAWYVPAVALLGAGLMLSHNLMALIAAPGVLLWVGALLWTRGSEWRRPALLCTIAAVWGLALAAFFLLPALTEGDAIRLDDVARDVPGGEYLYKHNFVGWGDLFLQRTDDYSLLVTQANDTPVQLGWFQWGLALLSLPACYALWQSGRRRKALAAAVFAVCIAIGVFMTVPASRFIWDAFHSLRFVQFPWRYIGLAAIGMAGLAGAWFAVLRDRALWLRFGLAALLVAIFVGTGMTFFEPFYRCTTSGARPISCPGNDQEYFDDPRFASLHYEGMVGGYLPADVEVRPTERPSVLARVVSGDARIVGGRSGTDWVELSVEASGPARIEAQRFEFPTWRVRVDGATVPHEVSEPAGLVVFDVPAGTHEVTLRLEDTTVRRVGNAISLVAWAALVLGVPVALIAPRARRWLAR